VRNLGAKTVNTFNVTLGPGTPQRQGDDFITYLQSQGIR
jgi:hypothetical protein